MSASPAAAPAVAVARRSMNNLRVSCRNLIVKVGRRSTVTTASVGYSNNIGGRVVTPKVEDSPYLLNAEVLHGDEQAFWLQRRAGALGSTMPMPYWDRMAQTVVLMSRRAARVPQEAAFRLMAVYLKMIMMVKLVDLSSMMLPVWMSHNVQGLLGSELEKKNGDGEPKKEGEEKKDGAAPADAAAAAPVAADAPKA